MTTRQIKAQEKKARIARIARMAQIHAENQAIVATGKCPHCTAGLKRNLSLTGWWQCEQYGAEGFRKDSSKPACGWQGFTE